jgi:predicted phage terminase large subunit-like protein
MTAPTTWPEIRTEAVQRILKGQDRPARDLERAMAEEAHRSLSSFVQQLWHVLEPGRPLTWGWHLELLCRTLERITSGELRRVLVCMPPGTAKSIIASVFWLSWWMLRDPTQTSLTLSSSDKIAIRDSRKMREVVRSQYYRRLVAHQIAMGRCEPWTISRDQNVKVRWENTARGGRLGFSTGGSVTGERANGGLIDDPHQLKDILGTNEHIELSLGKAHDKVDVVLPSRVNDRRTAWWLTIMQRLHMGDIASRQIEDPEVYKLILPMHAYEWDDPWRHPDDPRAPGELLDPLRLPEHIVAAEAEKLERQSPGQASAQFEQRPIPTKGGIFQRAWLRKEYLWDPQRPPKPYDEVVISCDLTFKASKTSAFVSLQVWGRHGWHELFLLDEVHERLSYVDTKQRLRALTTKWNPAAVLVETKANGEALIDDLRAEIPTLIGFSPDKHGDKVARAQLATPSFQAGIVHFPMPIYAPWVGDYLNELAQFPGAVLKDRVDAVSQLFLWWQERRGNSTTTANLLANMRGTLAAIGRR